MTVVIKLSLYIIATLYSGINSILFTYSTCDFGINTHNLYIKIDLVFKLILTKNLKELFLIN